jgi:cytochrome c553
MLTTALLALGSFALLALAFWGSSLGRSSAGRDPRETRTFPVRRASSILPGVLALGLLLVAAAFSFPEDRARPTAATSGAAASTVTLPIEVIGPDGTTESITVGASDVSNVDSLYLRAYSIGYPYYENYDVNKASIRLNGGSWVDLTDAIATCKYPESQWECIDGPYHTIRFEVAVSDLGALQDGDNTVSFRFNYAFPSDSPNSHGDVSTGFRILDLEFRTGTDADAIDGTDFVWDDPGSWTAPDGYDNATAVSEGEDLWSSRNTLVDGWQGPEIWASCADCHEKDGRDLAYFAFSNKSIVERSEFHGLSEDQGKKIAAYIRSQVLKDPDTGTTYEAPGRPWEPPYQPGPTALASRQPGDARETGQSFDKLSSQLWAAGAGVDWALERDEDMWPFVQGDDGVFTYEDVAVDSTLNLRQLPVNLQLPDWNEWLPRHHPMDLFGDTFRDGADRRDPWGKYTENGSWSFQQFEDCMQSNGGDASQCGNEYFKAVKGFYADSRVFQRYVDGSQVTSNYTDLSVGLLQSSVAKWQAVKQWELVHGYDMADEGKHWRSEVESLTWIADARQVFDIPPHITGEYVGPSDREYDLYLDNAWYQLQTVINNGRGISTGINPMDWRYQFEHINNQYKALGKEHSMRFMTTFVKVNQNCDVDGMYDMGGPKSWFFRRGHCDFGAEMLRRDWVYPKINEVTNGQALKIYEEMLRANFRGFGKYSTDAWDRKYAEKGWEPSDFTPSLSDPWYEDRETPSHYYKTLNQMSQLGASQTLIDSIAKWAEQMNPNGNWEQWMGTPDNVAPSVTLTSPSDGTTRPAPTSFSLAANASDEDGSVSEVTFYAGDTKLSTNTSAPYEASWSDVGAGSYILSAEAVDDDGARTVSAVDVTVTTDAPPNGVNYAYYEGDWALLPDYTAIRPVATGTTSAFDLSVRERDDQFSIRYTTFVRIPSSSTGSYTFYTSSDDGSALLVDGQKVVDNDGLHGTQEASGSISLSEGWHRIVVEYFEQGNGEALSVSWKGPDFAKEPIPANRLYRTTGTVLTSQNVNLEDGWNVISSDVAPDTAALETVFSDVNVALVKDEDEAVFDPSADRNEIGDWDSNEAYKVYTESSQVLTINGTAVDATTAISLEQGWNLVPYLPDDAQSISSALQSISDELVMVKDEAGNSYVPAYNIDQIGQLEPEDGYQIYVNSAVDLVYPTGSKNATAQSTSSGAPRSTTGGDNR